MAINFKFKCPVIMASQLQLLAIHAKETSLSMISLHLRSIPYCVLFLSCIVYAELRATGKFEVMNRTMDEEEHSLEMHLPFIAKVMESKKDRFTVVPVLVGAIKSHQEQEYGKIFSSYLADPESLFVISSDFCHWGELQYVVIFCGSSNICTYCPTVLIHKLAGKRFHYTSYDKSEGPIHSSIEALDRAVSCIEKCQF